MPSLRRKTGGTQRTLGRNSHHRSPVTKAGPGPQLRPPELGSSQATGPSLGTPSPGLGHPRHPWCPEPVPRKLCHCCGDNLVGLRRGAPERGGGIPQSPKKRRLLRGQALCERERGPHHLQAPRYPPGSVTCPGGRAVSPRAAALQAGEPGQGVSRRRCWMTF